MKNLLIIITSLVVLLAATCTSEQKPIKKTEDPKDTTLKVDIKTGWLDPDTYTVMVTDANQESAIAKAKHRILKDIVNVRVMNQSRYTDISKIKDEFEKPLARGKVVHKQEINGGTEFYFQIRDKDLKKKFERQ